MSAGNRLTGSAAHPFESPDSTKTGTHSKKKKANKAHHTSRAPFILRTNSHSLPYANYATGSTGNAQMTFTAPGNIVQILKNAAEEYGPQVSPSPKTMCACCNKENYAPGRLPSPTPFNRNLTTGQSTGSTTQKGRKGKLHFADTY